ncbi:DNA polymerase-3 subunit epsilon [Roseovarius pacificus]|uniref:DNA-directed DNA polymerase n=1 Tax=Roseovarius pacificus TaxID=337701 RepID=A0A1M6YI04_9RHOB|nr:exonuclease domain-containing protein [Roseovarius pacificus]GGO50832.1 DNA polymerase III subunit epsilon [Roseovarius pacificus]SHL17877.1 DNA polymerase-3 subunit epsilon [Roseovarius pacificus]
MRERLGLRLRFALFFAALALAGAALIAGGLWLGHSRYGGPVEGYVIAGLIAAFGLFGISAWIGFLFDENVARPVLALASDLQTRARAKVDQGIDQSQARHLGALAPAADAIHTALAEARQAQREAVEHETAAINREKALLEALLRDLTEGTVVLTSDRRIMLYNRVAQELLGDIGLNRPIDRFLCGEPLLHALERLTAKHARGDSSSERFLSATADGRRFVMGRVSPVRHKGETVGHVLTFHDATDDLRSHAAQDHLFNTLLEEIRRHAAAITALLDAAEVEPETAKTQATGLSHAMREEMNRLCQCLRDSSEKYRAQIPAHWPMAQVAVDDILDTLAAHDLVRAIPTGHADFLLCDGFAIAGLLARVIEGLSDDGTRSHITLSAEPHGAEVWLTLGWQGPDITDGMLDNWLRRPLSEGYGDYSGRDVLASHRTEIWSDPSRAENRIVLPLPKAGPPILTPDQPRPEFYDFNLPAQDTGSDLATTPLSELQFVVFDTETTGLAPREGDEIVQIAGVRVVNGRILSGEAFDTFVNPGRPIPPASTRIHGISDEMVRGAPDIAEAGRRFHAYCEGAVLVAHNAPFDMAFLRLKEDRIGLTFDQPTLCTVLLSAALFDHTGQHTLDALAERFGVTIPPEHRHTALGDSFATAEVFVHMLDVMKSAGIVTLGDAMAEAGRMVKIRRAQTY